MRSNTLQHTHEAKVGRIMYVNLQIIDSNDVPEYEYKLNLLNSNDAAVTVS